LRQNINIATANEKGKFCFEPDRDFLEIPCPGNVCKITRLVAFYITDELVTYKITKNVIFLNFYRMSIGDVLMWVFLNKMF